jgi:hypothetical protein
MDLQIRVPNKGQIQAAYHEIPGMLFAANDSKSRLTCLAEYFS